MTNNKTKQPSKIETSKTHDLAGLIDYSEGSTVSRILYKSDKGSVTLFSFDEGQSLSEHTAPFDAMVQAIEGNIELTIGGEKVNVAPGQVVIMPANVPHGVYASERFKMLLTMIGDIRKE